MSPEFRRLAQATQIDYQRYLDMVSRAWGQLLVNGVRPKHVIALRDTFASAPVAANHLLGVLKTLINWGIPREFSETNPCISVPKLVIDEGGARPWPGWAFDLIESHAREDLGHAVWLARYTGQRQADVLRMSKKDIDGQGINVIQQKTGKSLWVPLHADLASEMRSWNVTAPWFFVQTPKAEQYDTQRFREAWTRLMNDTPAKRIRAEGFTFHGLRASSCEKLREAGCDDAMIESVTGMSQPIVRRYLRFANQRQLAKAAILQLERSKLK
ncbi:MAG: tyrosine-type recombinase/integrase [Methyloceanibacter sp.]